MTYRGKIRNGAVVLDGPVELPEGTEVQIVPTDDGVTEVAGGEVGPSLAQKLLRHAGKAVNLPSDAAFNHDHYLYGTPKR